MSATLQGKAWCYFVPANQDPSNHGGFVPSLVVANEPGHTPMTGNGERMQQPWVWGTTFKEAEETCAYVNNQRGIDPETARKIVESSMFHPFKPYKP